MPTFNGDTLTITLDSGVTEVDVVNDVYKAWKDWMLASPLNRKYPQAFVSDGGNPLSSIINQGSYIFLQNDAGWRIKPPEEDITVYLTGNLAVADTTLPAFVPTDGTFTAAIIGLQPITQGVTETMGAQLSFSSFNGGIYWDDIDGLSGIVDDDSGNESNPLKNMTDVVTAAVTKGFSKIHVASTTATVTNAVSLDGYRLDGVNRSHTFITFGAGADTGDLSIEKCRFTGSMNGGLYADNCTAGAITGVGCTTNPTVFNNCLFNGNLTLRSDNNQPVALIRCGSIENNVMTLDVNGTSGDVTIHGYHDRLTLKNITTAINVHVTGAGMELIIDSTCTAGTIELHGNIVYTNNGTMTLDDDTTQAAVWDEAEATAIYAAHFNRRKHESTANTITIYAADKVTPLYVFDATDGLDDITPQ